MAKFPVSADDQTGIADAVNYLLSGPTSLGQNFSGFSSYEASWLTGNFRTPFSQPEVARLYVSPIALANSEMLDNRTFKFTFAETQSEIPFSNGNGIEVYGVDDDWYNDSYNVIGVVECTTAYVIARTSGEYGLVGPAGGGYVFLRTGDQFLSTDANCRVSVNSATDRVFISAQLDADLAYSVDFSTTDTLTYTVSVNRYRGEPTNDALNPDFLFDFDGTVARRIYTFTNLKNDGTIPLVDTIFATILDQPNPGYLWYIVEVQFEWTDGHGEIQTAEFTLRSISAQVVKQ